MVRGKDYSKNSILSKVNLGRAYGTKLAIASILTIADFWIRDLRTRLRVPKDEAAKTRSSLDLTRELAVFVCCENCGIRDYVSTSRFISLDFQGASELRVPLTSCLRGPIFPSASSGVSLAIKIFRETKDLENVLKLFKVFSVLRIKRESLLKARFLAYLQRTSKGFTLIPAVIAYFSLAELSTTEHSIKG